MRRIRKVRASQLSTDMLFMEGTRGRKICEFHYNHPAKQVEIVYKGADGRFEHKTFGAMHKVTVKY